MATELTLVAKYESFVSKAQDILNAAAAKQWAPATTEFIDIAKQGGSTNVHEVGDFLGFLGALQVRQDGGQKRKPLPPSSLLRVNLFAHGTKTAISPSGSVKQPKSGAAFADVVPSNGVIDLNSLDVLENQSDEQQESSAKVFAKGGGIFIYACESGVSEDVLQSLANSFRVDVHGFRDFIEFCPRKNLEKGISGIPRGVSGLFYKLGETSCDTGSFDFHKVVASVTKSPRSPGTRGKKP
jgi:hypothetical protein